MIDALTLDQMRIFVAAVDQGSFSAAARKLGRVQSAVSQSIAALEANLGLALFDRSAKTPRLTRAGEALIKDARRVLQRADELKARAASIASDVEPELSFAVDPIFPHGPLIASLTALSAAFPKLPVTIFTENLGGSEQRLRDGVAQFAIAPMPLDSPRDLAADFLSAFDVAPVVSAEHPLAREPSPVSRATLEPYVQLVLTDRTPLTQNFSGGIVGHHIWRFADLSTRLEFLLAGFGWCNMPLHLVREHIAAGRLKTLELAERDPFQFRVHVMRMRGTEIGRAGRWLIDDLRRLIAACPEAYRAEPQPPS
ncbi:DNA-binding transcriptional LysR family regulator [Roseiarcus fermentans]|uniref:DNA-binding transcriptional LysR family regulator n=1 Tax=Roseiarcus fermentans TaxID=1473586 RepID=A0A366EV68_9HYPH|nr:LysR family transcriptional regulator [Roseiarcus fermentans]RBP06293.1 DNA-binding transcriptional LysR family regulator [Roseiarcus fermentans]